MKYSKTVHMIYSKHNLFRHDYFEIRKYNSDCSNHDTTLHCKLKRQNIELSSRIPWTECVLLVYQ